MKNIMVAILICLLVTTGCINISNEQNDKSYNEPNIIQENEIEPSKTDLETYESHFFVSDITKLKYNSQFGFLNLI